MASYPFLYAAASSVLPKLDPDVLKRLFKLPHDMEKDVMEWKEILSNLPSFIETHEFSKEGFIAISEFVYGCLDLLLYHSNYIGNLNSPFYERNLNYPISYNRNLKDWESLVGHVIEFANHYYSKTSKQLLIEESSSGVRLGELDTRTSLLLSSLKAPDVKPLDDLPPQLLPCLAYCALYPEGSTFVRETLIYQWMAEGFLIGDSFLDESSEQVEKGNLYFNKLLEKGVFVEPMFTFGGRSSNDAHKRIHGCKMHPDIYSAVCRMASNEVLIIPDTKQGSAAAVTTRYVAFHKEDNAEIHYEFILQPRTCLCFIPEINKAALESLLSKCGELRVLDLAGTQFEELPSELTASTKLRYLALSKNTLLKTLDCKFLQLKTLSVDECVLLNEGSAGEVEILQLSHCPELKSFDVSSDKTEILRIFECSRLKYVRFLRDPFYQVGSPRDRFNLRELVCHNCDSLDLDVGQYKGYRTYVEFVGLPKLIELNLSSVRSESLMVANCSNLKSMDNHLQGSSKCLETLRIYDCPKLEISPKVLSSMIKLKIMDLKTCPTIMTTTFSNDAAEDLVPWIWNKDREFIFDGQRPISQEVSLFEENDAALRSLIQSSSAQTSSYLPGDSSYFKMGSEYSKRTEDSRGLPDSCTTQALALISEINICPKWRLEQHKLYCSRLFPDDFEFERDALVQLWMAQELFLVPLEHFGYISFDHLFKEGFIIKTRTDILTGIDKYKINREEATTLSNQDESRDRFALIDDGNGLTVLDKSKCRYVSVVGQKINEETFKTLEGISELRTVLLIRDYGYSLKQIPSSFFEALTCTQALDLSGSHISELPSSIGNMTQLHFLDLSFTLLERIPESIARLGELQTLKLKGCKHLHTLPKGLEQIGSLRHLDFDILGQLTSMPKRMGQLTELRTLQAFVVSEEDGCTIRELENLNKLGGSFCISGLEYASVDDVRTAKIKPKQLTRLHLKWNDSVSYDNIARQNTDKILKMLWPAGESSLEELKITYYPGLTIPKWERMRSDPKKLVRLELITCEVSSFEAPDQLPNLKYLSITDMNGVSFIHFTSGSEGIRFPKLETLIIDGMLNLRNWTGLTEYDCPHLSQIRVNHCPKLTGFFQFHFLKSLAYLEMSHCDLFETLSYSPLPKSLETLIINNCPSLKVSHPKIIEHVPNIWIDMKRPDIAADSNDSDSSDEEIDHSSDSDKETGTSKDVSDDVTMM